MNTKHPMTKRLDSQFLFRLRNHIPVDRIIADALKMPCKTSEGHFRFLCPVCAEFDTATNHKTNLARCFRCNNNFNPIDLVMIVNRSNFLDAVAFLRPLLGNLHGPPRGSTKHRPADQPERIGVIIRRKQEVIRGKMDHLDNPGNSQAGEVK